MRTREWLSSKSPQPPNALASAVHAAVEDTERVAGNKLPDEFIAASRRMLPKVFQGGCEARSGALDLLTLDALLTYAMETAAGSGETERIALEALALLSPPAQVNPREPAR